MASNFPSYRWEVPPGGLISARPAFEAKRGFEGAAAPSETVKGWGWGQARRRRTPHGYYGCASDGDRGGSRCDSGTVPPL
ncbi:hypothetical protein GCM10010315_35090 [Streptomyces luteosporeus]|uniref:Uncharacterized protein n=1 Tax=Streptomyces luteosporeus TaxID=173856 RepID=A0ABP6GBF9_9ACTN